MLEIVGARLAGGGVGVGVGVGVGAGVGAAGLSLPHAINPSARVIAATAALDRSTRIL
jgi:hypothetical protein